MSLANLYVAPIAEQQDKDTIIEQIPGWMIDIGHHRYIDDSDWRANIPTLRVLITAIQDYMGALFYNHALMIQRLDGDPPWATGESIQVQVAKRCELILLRRQPEDSPRVKFVSGHGDETAIWLSSLKIKSLPVVWECLDQIEAILHQEPQGYWKEKRARRIMEYGQFEADFLKPDFFWDPVFRRKRQRAILWSIIWAEHLLVETLCDQDRASLKAHLYGYCGCDQPVSQPGLFQQNRYPDEVKNIRLIEVSLR